MITRVPYQAYARTAPVADPLPVPTAPEGDLRPPSDADAYYRRQRELDYWRMRREAMRPSLDEDRSYRSEHRRQPPTEQERFYRGSEYRRQPPSDDYLPFPATRDRAERLD